MYAIASKSVPKSSMPPFTCICPMKSKSIYSDSKPRSRGWPANRSLRSIGIIVPGAFNLNPSNCWLLFLMEMSMLNPVPGM